jgi:hypothetical protein
MGFSNYEGGKFFNIIGGKFTQRVPEGTAGAVQRTNKLGTAVWEIHHDAFTGKLVNIKTQDSPYGKNWVFSFKDNEDTYNLQLGYANGYSVAFLKMLPNIDVSKPMKVSPRSEEKDGKISTALFVNQDGKPIKHFYTKDNQNGLPQWEQITVKGQLVWDSTKQLQFLENMVKTTILPKLEGLPQSAEDAQADKDFEAAGTEPVEEAINPSDLPF